MRVFNVTQPGINTMCDQSMVTRGGNAIHEHSCLPGQRRGPSLTCVAQNKGDSTYKAPRLPLDFRTIVLACVAILYIYTTGFAFVQTVVTTKSFNPQPNLIKDLENTTNRWGAFSVIVCALSVLSAYFDTKRDLNKKSDDRLGSLC